MRLVIALAAAAALPALALALPAGSAQAQGPVATQPLAAGEVLLEVDAVGRSTTRADLATFHLVLTCHGATEAEARRESEQQIERVRAAARAVGVAAADVVVNSMPMIPDAADPETRMAIMGVLSGESPEADPAKRHVVRTLIEIRLRNADRVPDLQQRLRAIDIATTNGPTYSLTDDRAARRSARADAIASARSSAESYADSLGMRVARIVRVSERIGLNPLNLMTNANLGWAVHGPGGSPRPDVDTHIVVGVDFALAPR